MLHIIMPFSTFISSCSRVAAWNFSMLGLALDSEIEQELAWAQQRPESLFNIADCDLLGHIKQSCVGWATAAKLVLELVQLSRFHRAMNASEARRLVEYRFVALRKGGAPALENLSAHLGQEPL